MTINYQKHPKTKHISSTSPSTIHSSTISSIINQALHPQDVQVLPRRGALAPLRAAAGAAQLGGALAEARRAAGAAQGAGLAGAWNGAWAFGAGFVRGKSGRIP